jgi:hypothetical protein
MLTFPHSIPLCYFGGAVDTISPNLPILAYEAMKLTATMTAVVLVVYLPAEDMHWRIDM